MSKSTFRRALALVLCAVLLPINTPAKADSFQKTGRRLLPELPPWVQPS